MTTTLSLCICTMNRPVELAAALRSVRAGTVQPHELIVSDDGDGSARSVAEEFGATYQVGPRRGLGPNRNACIRAATGSAIAFVDDDVVVSDSFVEHAVEAASSDSVVTGWEMNHASGAEPRKVTPHNADFLGFQRVEPPSGHLRSIVINATVFPRELFEQALFDERIRYGYEEIDMARQATTLGFAIRYDDRIWVNHHPSSSNRDTYNETLAASRLYLTYRAYRCYEHRPLKASTFAAVASAHHVAHAVRRGGGLKGATATLRMASSYWRAAREDPADRW